MNFQETAVLVNSLIKNEFGRDLQIGEGDDIYNKSSFNLQTFLGDDSQNPLNDQIGNFLLAQGSEDIDSLVWNALCGVNDDIRYSGRLLAMHSEIKKAYKNSGEESDDNNRTKEYSTARLLVKPLSFSIRDALIAEIRKEGCFEKETFCQSLACAFHGFKIDFGIYLKDGGNLIGFIGLSEDASFKSYGFDTMGGIEYYIYENYRKKGYAKEALASLVGVAFSKQTFRKEESKTRKYCFVACPFSFDIIKTMVDENNIGSYKTCLAAGFKEEGKISVIDNGKEHYEYYLSINKSDRQIKK
jgi:RimJ/RimL family protein N-acetyltransferase